MNSTFPSGLISGDYATGGAIAIIAIMMVFIVLLSIIIITELVGKLTSGLVKDTPVAVAATTSAAPITSSTPLNVDDEDATVAALVASIDYREETKMNIRVVSVKEVK